MTGTEWALPEYRAHRETAPYHCGMRKVMEDRKSVPPQKRVAYLDALRLCATLAVIVIHLAATGYKEAVPESYEWTVCLIYNTVTRFAVPAFVMISGAMYLEPARVVTMKQMLKKAGRIMSVFLCWSLLFALTESMKDNRFFSADYFCAVAHRLVRGHYHMWYLYTITGLYLATPFLRVIAAEGKLLEKYIMAVFLLNFCLRIAVWIPGWEETAEAVLNHAATGVFTGFTGYYCLGYYLHNREFTKKQVCGIFLLSLTILAVFLAAGVLLKRPDMAFSEQMPQVFLYSCGVFLLFKTGAKGLETGRKIVETVIPCTFGIYLIHPVFNFLLRRAGLYALTFDPLLCIPLCALLVFGGSLAVIWCMRKTPVLRKLT